MNNCSFTGRLTTTPELKTTPNGKNVCSFTLAVERTIKGSDGKPIVDFIDFVAWQHNADFICKWFDKGVRVAITGGLQTRTYTDNDGNNRKVFEVLVNTVEFADGKREANTVTETTTVTKPDDDGFMPIGNDDDLPFFN